MTIKRSKFGMMPKPLRQVVQKSVSVVLLFAPALAVTAMVSVMRYLGI